MVYNHKPPEKILKSVVVTRQIVERLCRYGHFSKALKCGDVLDDIERQTRIGTRIISISSYIYIYIFFACGRLSQWNRFSSRREKKKHHSEKLKSDHTSHLKTAHVAYVTGDSAARGGPTCLTHSSVCWGLREENKSAVMSDRRAPKVFTSH